MEMRDLVEVGKDMTAHRYSRACPEDLPEIAEDYCLGRLADSTRKVFDRHLLTCPLCLGVVEDTRLFLDAINNVIRDKIASGEIIVHAF